MVVMAPSDEAELIHMVATSAAYDAGPICFRFPRGNGTGLDLAAEGIIGYKGQPMQVRPPHHGGIFANALQHNFQHQSYFSIVKSYRIIISLIHRLSGE